MSSNAPLAQGQRVRIVADWHPWKGQEGTLVAQPEHRRFPWRVHFKDENGIIVKAAVHDAEVVRVEE